MNFGHAFQSVLPKPQLIQFSRLLFKRNVHPRRAIVWQHTLSNCPGWVFVHVLHACVHVCVCVWNHIFTCLTIIVLYAREYLLHVNPCVHMHLCVLVDTLSGGFHIAQQKGSVVALCAQSYKRGFLKHICPLHGVLIRLSISPPDTRTITLVVVAKLSFSHFSSALASTAFSLLRVCVDFVCHYRLLGAGVFRLQGPCNMSYNNTAQGSLLSTHARAISPFPLQSSHTDPHGMKKEMHTFLLPVLLACSS